MMKGSLILIALSAIGIWMWTRKSSTSRPVAQGESFARMRTDRDEPSRLFADEERLYERL